MKKCPKCKLINPDEAEECDCGYNFEYKMVLRDTGSRIALHKPIIQLIFTTLLIMILGSFFCIHNRIGPFVSISYQFNGIAGLIVLWLITIICISIILIPTIISWLVFYLKHVRKKSRPRHH